MLTKAIAGLPDGIFPDIDKTIADSIGGDMWDLHPFYSVLVSTVTNKNTDAFDRKEVWRSKNSPKFKPLNFMHDQKRIYGHIIDCRAVDDDMKPIPDNTSEGDLPYKLHIITANILYKIWEDKAQQDHINAIIDKMTKGEIYVSMECLFRDFDFLLTNADGSQSLVPRTEKTNGLMKYLRQYGGPGQVYGKTIARLLKNITFSGVGLVDNPANPESVISNKLDIFKTNSESSVSVILPDISTNIDVSTAASLNDDTAVINSDIELVYKTIEQINGDKLMSNAVAETNSNEFKVIADKLEKLVAENTRLEIALNAAKAEKECESEKDKEIASLKEQVRVLSEEKDKVEKDEKGEKGFEAKAADLEKSLAETKVENDAYRATIEAYKKAERGAARTLALMNADKSLTREAAFAQISTPAFEAMSDESFAATVSAIAGYAAKAPKEITPAKVLSGAKAEAEVNYGTSEAAELDVVKAQVKEFLRSTKKGEGK